MEGAPAEVDGIGLRGEAWFCWFIMVRSSIIWCMGGGLGADGD